MGALQRDRLIIFVGVLAGADTGGLRQGLRDTGWLFRPDGEDIAGDTIVDDPAAWDRVWLPRGWGNRDAR